MSRSTSAPREEASPLVEVNNLETYYGGDGPLSGPPIRAVDDVSFDIHEGETFGIVGESGCGKTTLGRTLVNLEQATGGEVRFDGTDITRLSGEALTEWRRNTQIVFQDPESSLNERITIGEVIREPLDVHNWKTPADRREKVRELLQTVGLQPEHYYRYAHQFSGGQKQRIAIARALVLEPDFVVLDEPTSALDVSVQAKILNLLEDLQAEFDLTYLFISHDLSVIQHVCDRVAVMYLGRIMEISETDALFEDPANPYTHALLSAIPEPNPDIESTRITLRGAPPSPRYPPDGCVFSTRCPMKIPAAEYAHLDEELLEAIEAFRDVVRQRVHEELSLTERARELLGLETQSADVTEIRAELFDHLDVPEDVAASLDVAADHLSNNRDREAKQYLFEQFGSECDRSEPTAHGIDDGWQSRCHRHASEHESPADVSDLGSEQ